MDDKKQTAEINEDIIEETTEETENNEINQEEIETDEAEQAEAVNQLYPPICRNGEYEKT